MKPRVHVRHEREGTYAELTTDRELKSGKLDVFVLDETDLIELAQSAIDALLILHRKR